MGELLLRFADHTGPRGAMSESKSSHPRAVSLLPQLDGLPEAEASLGDRSEPPVISRGDLIHPGE